VPKGRVYRTPTELFADMPRSAYPKFGPAFGIERAAARKWFNENVVGRTIEWTATVKEVAIDGDGPFDVRPTLDWYEASPSPLFGSFAFGGEFAIGGQACQVCLNPPGEDPGDGHIRYQSCTAAEAGKLRGLKGKRVAFRAQVTGTDVGDENC